MAKDLKSCSEEVLRERLKRINVELESLMKEKSDIGKEIERRKLAKLPTSKYEEFKKIIQKSLRSSKRGLTWTEIKAKAGLRQKVPNNKWVRMLETNIGLIREKDKERGVIWRLEQ